jgi:hypothetical protein
MLCLQLKAARISVVIVIVFTVYIILLAQILAIFLQHGNVIGTYFVP